MRLLQRDDGEAEHDQGLPRQRIEEPCVLRRPARQAKLPCQRRGIERKRCRKRGRERAARDDDEHERQQQEHNVERQDVEVADLVGEQHEADGCARRIGEGRARAMPSEQQRVVEDDGTRAEQRDGDGDDHDLRAPDLECTQEQACDHLPQGPCSRLARGDEGKGATRQEHEQLGRIRNGIVAEREVRIDHAGDMVDEDHHKRDAPPEINRVGRSHSPSCSSEISRSPLRLNAYSCGRTSGRDGTFDAGRHFRPPLMRSRAVCLIDRLPRRRRPRRDSRYFAGALLRSGWPFLSTPRSGQAAGDLHDRSDTASRSRIEWKRRGGPR